jgi:hypothetical protein
MTKGSSSLASEADLATTFALVVPIPGARADRGAECDARVVAGVRVKAAGLCCLNFGPASVRAGRGCRGSDWGDSAGLELRHWPILSVIILAEADAVCAKCA